MGANEDADGDVLKEEGGVDGDAAVDVLVGEGSAVADGLVEEKLAVDEGVGDEAGVRGVHDCNLGGGVDAVDI